MPGGSSLPCADCVNLPAMPGIHALMAPKQGRDGRGTSPALTKIAISHYAGPATAQIAVRVIPASPPFFDLQQGATACFGVSSSTTRRSSNEHPDKTGARRDGAVAPQAGERRCHPEDRAAGARQDRRHAADGGDREAALGARIRAKRIAAAAVVQPVVGGRRRQPRRRRTHRAVGDERAGDRRLCRAAVGRLSLRRRSECAATGRRQRPAARHRLSGFCRRGGARPRLRRRSQPHEAGAGREAARASLPPPPARSRRTSICSPPATGSRP